MKKFPWIFLRLVSLSSIQLRVTAESLKVIARVQPSRLSSDGRASITPPPLVQNQYLRERAALATCGYVSGNPALPLTCPRDYSCTSTIMIDAAWACCNQIECAGAYQTCINYGDDLCPGLESSECSNIYVSYLSCASAAPSCRAYARSRSIDDTDIRYSWTCGTRSDNILALATTTTPDAEVTTTDDPFTSMFRWPTENSPSSTRRAVETVKRNGTSSDGGTPNIGGSGAIAGIVIAAVAILVAIVVAWWRPKQVLWVITCGLCGRKHRTPRDEQQNFHRASHIETSQPPPAYSLNSSSNNLNFGNGNWQQNAQFGVHNSYREHT